MEEGSLTLGARARREIARLLERYREPGVPSEARAALVERAEAEARRHGMDRLPARTP
jgi:hypothetical protein